MHSDLAANGSAPSTKHRRDDDIFDAQTAVELAKKLSLFFLIYLMGYFGAHMIWPYAVLALIVFHDYRQKEKKRRLTVARSIALGFEQEIVLNTLQNLPAWIKFSEIERVEWLNKIFKLVWAKVNEYSEDLVPKILEPAIQGYVSDFKFDVVRLGNVPLRVDGVKVYDQEDKRKIVMDLDVSYAGDCYVTFQTFRFTGGIKDIQLRGRLRVVLTPLINKIPLIGGLQAYFLNPPHVDFDLIKVTQILDLPVIRNKIKSTTMKVINSMFLYPNAYSINLCQGVNVSKLALFRTEGILRVHVVEAKNLVNKDIIGKSDPYVVLKVGSLRVETPVVQNSLNPKWDFWREFEIDSYSELKVEVWDRDEGTKDDSLGHARIDISEVVKTGQCDKEIYLQGVEKGTIHIRLTWLALSPKFSDLAASIKEIEFLSPYLHTAFLMIYLESSLNLPMLSKNPPSPYVELEIENTTKKSDIEQETCEPVWDKAFTFLVRDPKRAVLNLRILDDESRKPLGEFFYKLDNLETDPHLELRRHTFFFDKPYSEASICCSMKLRILKNEHLEEKNEDDEKPRKVLVKQESNVSNKSKISQATTGSGSFWSDTELSPNSSFDDDIESDLGKIKISLSYSQQRQRLVIDIREAHIIQKHEMDPYVKLYLQTGKHKNNKRKTKIIKDTNNPIFEQRFEYLISTQDLDYTFLILVVEAETGFLDLRRKFLGQTVIALTKCANLTETFTEWYNLKSKRDAHVYHLVK